MSYPTRRAEDMKAIGEAEKEGDSIDTLERIQRAILRQGMELNKHLQEVDDQLAVAEQHCQMLRHARDTLHAALQGTEKVRMTITADDKSSAERSAFAVGQIGKIV